MRRFLVSLSVTLAMASSVLASPAVAEPLPTPAFGNDASKASKFNTPIDEASRKADGLLVQLTANTTLSAGKALLSSLSGRQVTSMKAVGFGVSAVRFGKLLSASDARELANEVQAHPNVAIAEPNWVIRISEEKVGLQTLQTGATWGLDRIDQRALPLNGNYDYAQTGTGVTAYVIDSGLNSSHSEFSGRVVSGVSYVSDGLGTGDCNGHGTHVAGTIAGTKYGVAKAAKIVPVRVADCDGGSTVDKIIQGLNWIRTNYNAANGRALVNISMGGGFSQQLNDAVANVVAANIPVVVASGNEGANACNVSPASAPSAITVNASTSTDDDASFSNFGPCTDIYAPGENITSAWIGTNSASRAISGTSMASPHVAGVVAQLLQKTPSASPATIWDNLRNNATKADFIPNIPSDPKVLLYTGTAPVNENPVEPDEADLSIYGATLAWDDATLFEPGSGCSSYTFTYFNGTGVNLYSVDLEITTRYQDSMSSRSAFSVTAGQGGNWSVQLCPFHLTNGLGPYFITFLIEDNSSAVYTAEKEITFLPRTGSSNQIVPLVPQEQDLYYMDIYGAYLIWDMNKLYKPAENSCSKYLFSYTNYTGIELWELGLEILDSQNGQLTSRSKLFVKDGVSGVLDVQLCSFSLTEGAGPYTLKFLVEDYYYIYSTSGSFSFRERPLQFTRVGSPSISGQARYGSTLTANTGTWDSGTTFEYQWLRGAEEIGGATASQYTPGAEDVGYSLSVRVTGVKAGYESASRTSLATPEVGEGVLQSTPRPSIFGTLAVGQTVGVSTGTWDDGVTMSIQWYLDGEQIFGADTETYLIDELDAGKALTVSVTGSKPFFGTVTMTSAERVIPLKRMSKTPTPTIKGTVQTGKKLTAAPGSWDSGVQLSYQWLKNGKSISGARSASYTLKKTDKGAKISVRVTGSKFGYASVSKTSKSVTPKK